MAWPTKKPASGMPASGPGWGGDAKGAGKGGAHAPQKRTTKRGKANEADATGAITTETAAGMAERGTDPEVRAVNAAKLADRVATAEELKLRLSYLAFNAEHEMTSLHATDKLLDRIEGKPTQKTELTGADGGPVAVTEIRRVIVDPKASAKDEPNP
jgi:hypothetical protein